MLVGGVGDWGWVGIGGFEWGDLDGDGGAGQVIEGAERGAAEDDGEPGVLKGEADLVGEGKALGDGCGLGGVPGNCRVGLVEIAGWSKGGGDDVDAVAAVGGVEDKASGGMGVVGNLRALVGGEGDGGVGVAGGDYGEAAGGEESSETGGEGQGDIFFDEVVREVGARIRASMGGVEEDDGAGSGLLGGGKREQARQDGEN